MSPCINVNFLLNKMENSLSRIYIDKPAYCISKVTGAFNHIYSSCCFCFDLTWLLSNSILVLKVYVKLKNCYWSWFKALHSAVLCTNFFLLILKISNCWPGSLGLSITKLLSAVGRP